jgi:hypothetical protein
VNTMNTQTNATPHDDDMPAEINFGGGVRGKFFSRDAKLNVPLYLDAPIAAYLSERAQAKGVGYAQLVNELLRRDIELIEAVR